MMDVSKERDLDFLRAAVKLVQERVLILEKKIILLKKEKTKDEEICIKLSEELFLLRKKIYHSKSDRRDRARELARLRREKEKKKKKKGIRPHNKEDYSDGTDLKDENKNTKIDKTVKLDSEDHVHKLEDANKCPKCGREKELKPINSFESSLEVDVIERRYVLKNHKRQKYHCKCCNNIITASGGAKLTPGGEFSIQLGTQIACDKYEGHLPLERQRKQMHRNGVEVSVKTLYGLTRHLYDLILPLDNLIKSDVFSCRWVHVDESPVTFYNPKKSRGWIWSLSNNRSAYYSFSPNRSGEIAKDLLKEYKEGNVVTDGLSCYSFLDEVGFRLKHCLCWSHVRRKFIDAMLFSKECECIVDWIDELYAIEREAKDLDHLLELRKKHSVKIVFEIDDWITSQAGHYLESTSLGKAIKYYNKRRIGLAHFLEDKYVPIDNNMAERRQRCPVLGRKNYLHFKSIDGADIGAFYYSVIESCKTNDLPVRAYMNEMANRAARGKDLESPYQYAKRLSAEIKLKLSQSQKFEGVLSNKGPP